MNNSEVWPYTVGIFSIAADEFDRLQEFCYDNFGNRFNSSPCDPQGRWMHTGDELEFYGNKWRCCRRRFYFRYQEDYVLFCLTYTPEE